MVNDRVTSKLVPSFSDDSFLCKGLTMSLEAPLSQVPKEPVQMKIQKIDVIYREEYEQMR